MEEYMTKTREDYGSRIARPKFDEKAIFELKGPFLKELRDKLSMDRIMKMQMNTLKESSDNSNGLAAIQAQLNNLGREIKKVNEKVYAAQVGCESCNGPHYTKDCLLKEEGKTLEEAYYTQFGLGKLAPTKLIVELADRTVKPPKGIAKNVLVGIGKFVFPVDFIVLDMPEDIKVPLILGRPFLSIAHAKIDVFKRKIALRIGNDKIVFKSDNPTSNIIKKVYVLGLREWMELDLEARLMGEALILDRSQDLEFGHFLELNEPLELRRNQEVDDLGLTIKEG
ncbi:gag-pol polyprotein [Tanacetum coccineum]